MLPSEYQLPDTPKDIPLGSRKSICIHTILFVLTEYLSIFRSPLIGVKRYQFPNSVRYTRRSVLDEHDMITRRVPIARGRGEGEGERRGYYWISFFQLYALPGYPSPSIFPFSIFSIYTWSALSYRLDLDILIGFGKLGEQVCDPNLLLRPIFKPAIKFQSLVHSTFISALSILLSPRSAPFYPASRWLIMLATN
jgi:hypothetical protein